MRLQIRTLPRSTLFPYTTLFRSIVSPGFRHHGEREKSRQSFLYYEDPFFFKKPMVRPLSSQQVTGVWVPTFHFPLSLSMRSEEHTSELQSLTNLVCRLLLEKKK